MPAARGQCFTDIGPALELICSTSYPAHVGGALHSCQGGWGEGHTGTLFVLQSNGSEDVYSYVTVELPFCDPLTWASGPGPWDMSVADSAIVAAAVAAAWVLAYAWRMLVRTLNSNDSSTD